MPEGVCTRCREHVDKKRHGRWIHAACWNEQSKEMKARKDVRDRERLEELEDRYVAAVRGGYLNRDEFAREIEARAEARE